jgi:hypothetical protein
VVSTAWDRRPDETDARYKRFVEYLHASRSERPKLLLKSGAVRVWAKQHDWAIRTAAYDDKQDRDYEQARLEQVREVRAHHAKAGRALLNFAVGRLTQVQDWSPGNLIKLADLARKMELTAVLGPEPGMYAASRAAVAATGADLDEWDRITADLAGTAPSR